MYSRSMLDAELKRDEGVRRFKYKDSTGHWTTGVGHNLDANPLPHAVYPLTDSAIESILDTDVGVAEGLLNKFAPWWTSEPDQVERVLLNMTFNLGWGNGHTGLSSFHQFLSLVQQHQYVAASNDMLTTLWAKQVGARANRLAILLREGV